jgi:glycerol-3-phosphate acyltransferase PlsY
LAELILIVAITSYLLGSIPFGYLLVRIFRGVDVRQTGSGNIGATNVARTGSKGLGIATLALDALKGFIAVAFAIWLADSGRFVAASANPQTPYLLGAVAALGAIVGHMFTVWLRFKGGKGVATGLGAFIALAPRAVLVSILLFVVVVAVTRYVSLGSILAAAVFPLAAWWLSPESRTAGIMVLIAASSLLIIVRHKDNIRRLLVGAEDRFQ